MEGHLMISFYMFYLLPNTPACMIDPPGVKVRSKQKKEKVSFSLCCGTPRSPVLEVICSPLLLESLSKVVKGRKPFRKKRKKYFQ